MKFWNKSKSKYIGFVELERNKESVFVRADHVTAVSQKNLQEDRVELSSGEAIYVAGALGSVMKIITEV